MIFGPSDAEFHLELEDTKKCIHQKLPKQRDSNGRSELYTKERYWILKPLYSFDIVSKLSLKS